MADPTPAASPGAALADTHGVVLEHVPYFVTPPGQPDQMLVVVGLFLLAVIVSIGLVYFYMHALPEKMAHRASHTQFQLVGILALLALFTHNSVFWVGALLLAALNIPDFLSPLNKIADALSVAARRLDPQPASERDAPETAAPAFSAAPTPSPEASAGKETRDV
ncbi:hypothetical protein P2H44_14060 [Albimonas sp. CAU 1670]|uniref:hypothetical protein n=1 Tax=Albimonas sp. CAU 1670 TaxID=3032599 RepID=UPI0023DBA5F4|nr:hypothetical protein [Albimonas sp. CAU 1670]MDF2233681.1 hypothetical protein [Albimonas sp. CAU 1670]